MAVRNPPGMDTASRPGQSLLLPSSLIFLHEDGIYDDVKEILTRNHISYDDTALRNACTGLFEMADYQTAQGCLTNVILKLIPMAMGDNKDLARLVSMHQMDVALNLLLDYVD